MEPGRELGARERGRLNVRARGRLGDRAANGWTRTANGWTRAANGEVRTANGGVRAANGWGLRPRTAGAADPDGSTSANAPVRRTGDATLVRSASARTASG
ncbi:hypothetical protein [Actinomadura gamaensis]|uniref:Uncharacterized protein n=1 Tax=Actinomadura gamaensis TaxID=1763541 RepID=A0ABV9UEB7_9ACTN